MKLTQIESLMMQFEIGLWMKEKPEHYFTETFAAITHFVGDYSFL